MSVAYSSYPGAPPPTPQAAPHDPGQGLTLALLLGGVPALALAIVMALTTDVGGWFAPLAIGVYVMQAAVVFADLRYGLALFILAAGLSPRLPGLYDNLRVEDFVFILCFFVWVARAMNRRQFPAPRSPLTLPFVLLTGMSLISTLYGTAIELIPDWRYAAFIQAKRVEYFLVFWMVVTTVKTRRWLELLLLAFVASGALAASYGLVRQNDDDYVAVSSVRVTGPEGENYNTLCGYLVVAISAGIAAMLGTQDRIRRLFIIACLGIMVLGLVFTYSREGYIMLAGAVASLAFTRQRGLLLVVILMLAPLLTLGPVRAHLAETRQTIIDSPTGDAGSNSLTARFRAWEWRWKMFFLKRPFFGGGVGSVELSVDNEYLMRACEVGLLGLSLFLWLLASIGAMIRRLSRLRRIDPIGEIFAIAVLPGFVGLLIQATVAPAFTTIRTMEPFWFLLGLGWAAYIIATQAARQRAEAQAAAWVGAA